MKKWLVLAAIVGLLVPLSMAAAQTSVSRTVTITEDDINASFHITNPVRRQFSDLAVDLVAPDTAVMTGVYTTRTLRGGTISYDFAATYTLSLTNGRIFVSLDNLTINGGAGSQSIVNQINAQINASWIRYLQNEIPGRITALEVTDTSLIITYAVRS
jgi:hypothetical protein